MVRKLPCILALATIGIGCVRFRGDAAGCVSDSSVAQNFRGDVYIVFGSKRHYIPNVETLKALDVAGLVKRQPDEAINAIPEGDPIPSLPGRAIQKGSTGEVFLIEAGKRRYIPDVETLDSLQIRDQVHGVTDAVVNAIPLGPPMPHLSRPQSAANPS
jgi:hypothetical protein